MIKKQLFAVALLMMLGTTAVNAQKYVGGDISLLPSYEAKNAVYKDKDGKTISDVLLFMKEQGCNAMRVRLFVDPSKASETHKKEGVVQDLEYVKALGKRIKDAGLYFLLDFHYSDTWTDPGKHSTPASWTGTTAEALGQQLYDYTVAALTELQNAGAEPDAIQVGNEITYGQLWPTGHIWPAGGAPSGGSWDSFYLYVKRGTEACREVCKNAKVVVHIEMSGEGKNVKPFLQKFLQYSPDFDVVGLSYYPYYHGDFSKLEAVLTQVETLCPDKEIQLVEAGYPNAWYPSDASFNYTSVYPDTEEGQRKFTADLITKLNAHPQVNGLYWWYPEANGNYFASSWYNMGLWNNSTHKALKALYELKNFLPDPAGIEEVKSSREQGRAAKKDVCYDLQGRRVQAPNGSSSLKSGIYIADGQLVVMK